MSLGGRATSWDANAGIPRGRSKAGGITQELVRNIPVKSPIDELIICYQCWGKEQNATWAPLMVAGQIIIMAQDV
jgi:hypothetical protein